IRHRDRDVPGQRLHEQAETLTQPHADAEHHAGADEQSDDRTQVSRCRHHCVSPRLITQTCVINLGRCRGLSRKKYTGLCNEADAMTERAAARAEMQERMLPATDRLFYEQGIRAVGVDTVSAEVGISKRTLYNYYPSKDDLIVAYLS